jgi:lipid-binding SYLF domain-containing protein
MTDDFSACVSDRRHPGVSKGIVEEGFRRRDARKGNAKAESVGRRSFMKHNTLLTGLLIALPLFSCGAACAATFEELDKEVAASTVVLKNMVAMPDQRIPRDLLQRCRGLAIFPGVIRAGVVVGVSFGSGVVVRRDEKAKAWSKPAFFRIREGSVGAQVGAQSIDQVLLIMSEEGMQGLLEDRYTLGADVAVAAGPVGREASAETSIRFDAGIFSYSRTKGLFAGLSLKGAVLEPDREANEAYHGKGVTVQDIFYEDAGVLSDAGRDLTKLISEVSGP